MRSWMAGIALGLCGLAPASHAQEVQTFGMVTIEGAPPPRPGPLDWLFGGARETLREAVESIRDARDGQGLAGLVIRLKDAELTAGQVEELGGAIRAARAAGVKVTVFAEAYGPTDLLLASYADRALGQPGGPVSLPGLYMEEMYLADTLAWAGLKADLVQVGDFKGAAEPMARSTPSPQWEQNIGQLLDSMYANMRGTLGRGRSMSETQLDRAMEALWMGDMADAVAAGLIDAEVDLVTLGEHLAGSPDVPVEFLALGRDDAAEEDAASANPLLMLQKLSRKPDLSITEPTIAIVHIDGAIVDGDSSVGGLTGEPTVGSRTIRNALESLIDEPLVRGVIVRIDSPGGSATASEMIWQGIRRVAAVKPVWTSVGDMAASGGYYCAVAGDRVFVNRASIVGSIGVVGGKVAMRGLYDHLEVNVVPRARGPRAAMLSTLEPWTDAERALVREKMGRTYDLFTRRVSAGRKGIDLSTTAEGRLFTGDKAVALAMADDIGGLDDAIRAMADALGVDDFQVRDYPAPKSLPEVLQDTFGGMVEAPRGLAGPRLAASPVGGSIEAVVGARAWRQIAPSVTGLLDLRERRVLLMSPRVLVFR
jgi:protease IV